MKLELEDSPLCRTSPSEIPYHLCTHWLTSEKCVHQFRYFLLVNSYCCLLMHKFISQQTGSGFSPITVPDNNRRSGLSPTTVPKLSTGLYLNGIQCVLVPFRAEKGNGAECIGSHVHKNVYMHEQITIEFGVRIGDRKNLNWCTPFVDVYSTYLDF